MLPIIFSIGPLHLYSFGLMLFLAFIIGLFLIWHFGRQKAADDFIFDLTFYALLIALIVGRVAFILENPTTFELNILKMLHVFNFPGFSFRVSLLTGALFALIFSTFKKQKRGEVLDFLVMGFIPALIIGQFGCLLNGCVIGQKTNLFWGLPVVGVLGRRHPLPLYEMLILIFLYFVIFKINRVTKKEGYVSALFFLILGFSQFLLEFIREGSVYWLGLKTTQIFDLLFILISVGYLIKYLDFKKILSQIKNIFRKSKIQ